jgi:hypothetical protein
MQIPTRPPTGSLASTCSSLSRQVRWLPRDNKSDLMWGIDFAFLSPGWAEFLVTRVLRCTREG